VSINTVASWACLPCKATLILKIQSNLFHSELFSQLDAKDPLIQLANTINWTVFDDAFEQHYSQNMTLCQIVKAIDNLNGKFGIGGIGDIFLLYRA
jgi:predicted secreted Zn-dependent protease